MKKELVAVALAGGIGKRFWPLEKDKSLFSFFGRSLFDFSVIDCLPREVTKLVVIANPMNAPLFCAKKFPIPTNVVVQSKPGGMADALLAAEAELQGKSLFIFISNNVLDKTLVQNVCLALHTDNTFGVLPGWKTRQYFPGGYLVLDGDQVTSIEEKPGVGNEPSEFVTISGHAIADADILFAELKKTKSHEDDVYEKALTALMKRYRFRMIPYEGTTAALKCPWHVLDVMELLLQRIKPYRGKHLIIKSGVTIEGPVYIEDNVRIFENTKIIGPCYIGANTVIGNNNIIRHSHIGSDCVTGFNSDITRSYVGNNCWFHSNYVGDSVLEENVSMGAGAVLANLRLDEGEIFSLVYKDKVNTGRTKLGAMIGKDVRIGVNTSSMPGVKIGKNSFIGSGVVLDRDIPDDSFCMAEPSYRVTKNTKHIAPNGREHLKKKL